MNNKCKCCGIWKKIGIRGGWKWIADKKCKRKKTYNLYDLKNPKKINHFATKKDLINTLQLVVGELSGMDYEDLTMAEKNILIKCERILKIN